MAVVDQTCTDQQSHRAAGSRPSVAHICVIGSRNDAAREEIRAIALARPRDLGEPGTRWSLARLRRYLIRHRIVDHVDKEHLRRILQSLGITAQRTRTGKWSNDPLYEAKKGWVLAAYQGAEAGTIDGVVVSFDECGPISHKPHAGSPQAGPPGRERPTTVATGSESCSAPTTWAPTDCGVVSRRRVTAQVVLEFLKDDRRHYPAETTVYIVMDNLSAHWTADIRRWAVDNNVGLLPTPTNASHLNRIECHFWAYVEFVINGSDYPDWTECSKATQAYIRRRNRDRHDPRIIELENRRKVA